jgi:hypothetical protein
MKISVKDAANWAAFALAFFLTIGSGLNGILWLGFEGREQAIIRFVALMAGVALGFRTVHSWSKRHVDTLGRAFVTPPEFTQTLRDQAAINLLSHITPNSMSDADLKSVGLLILYPTSTRLRVDEESSIYGSTLNTRITLDLDTGHVGLPAGRLIMLTRFAKRQGFGSFSVECNGDRLAALPFDETNAITLHATLAHMETHLATLPPTVMPELI